MDEGTVDLLEKDADLGADGKLALEGDASGRRRHVGAQHVEVLHRTAVRIAVPVHNPVQAQDIKDSKNFLCMVVRLRPVLNEQRS